MQPSVPQEVNSQPLEDEISLIDILNFLIDHWKIYVTGAILGLFISLGFVSLKGTYSGEMILLNQGSGLNFISWGALQKNLISLAQEISAGDKPSTSIQRSMAIPEWWKKAVKPTYALTKGETKELAGISKDVQDSESIRIQNFVIRVEGRSVSAVNQDIDYVAEFIRSGSTFFALRSMVLSLESKINQSAPKINLDMNNALQEIKILSDRRDYLYTLRKEFPNESPVAQVIDVNEGVAKFLPITTQLVAVLTDINALDERLLRLRQEKSQIEILGEFVKQSQSILKRGFQDQAVITDLMSLEASLRKNIPENELPKIIALDNVRRDLVSIKTSYTLGLQQVALPSVLAPKYLKPAAVGLLAGLFLGLVFSILMVLFRMVMSRRHETSRH